MKHIRLPFLGLVLAWARDRNGTAAITGDLMFASRLTAKHIRAGKVVRDYDLGSGLVTTSFCTALAVVLGGTAGNITTYKYHDSGTGTTAAAIGDTGLQTPAGPTTRATGTQVPSGVTYTTVGTIAYTTGLAITEWILADASSRGTSNIMDHKVFAAINVVNGDSIQFTYVLTNTAGG